MNFEFVNIWNMILSIILLGIPEEIFVIAMTLALLERFDLLDIYRIKKNWLKILLPSLVIAFILKSFSYIFNFSKIIISLSSFPLIIVAIFFIFKKNTISFLSIKSLIDAILNNSKLLKSITYKMFLSLLILVITESIYTPILFALTNTDMKFYEVNVFYAFLCVLPARIVEYSILIYFIVKGHNHTKVKVLFTLLKNEFVKKNVIGFTVGIIFIYIYVIKLIGYDNILQNIDIFQQILICIIILIIPPLFIIYIWNIINYTLQEKEKIQKMLQNSYNDDFEDFK